MAPIKSTPGIVVFGAFIVIGRIAPLAARPFLAPFEGPHADETDGGCRFHSSKLLHECLKNPHLR